MNFIDEMTECDIPLDKNAIDFFSKLGNYFIVLCETTEKDFRKPDWRGDVFKTERFVTMFVVHKNVSVFRHDIFYEDAWKPLKARIVGYLPLGFPEDTRVHL